MKIKDHHNGTKTYKIFLMLNDTTDLEKALANDNVNFVVNGDELEITLTEDETWRIGIIFTMIQARIRLECIDEKAAAVKREREILLGSRDQLFI